MTSITSHKYNLKQIRDISHSNFSYQIPQDTFDILNHLCNQIGLATVASRVYKTSDNTCAEADIKQHGDVKKKRRGHKNEASAEEWETLRTFQPTKMETKVGIEADLNELRLHLNKLTDKTFLDIRVKIIDKINSIIDEISENDAGQKQEMNNKIATTLYDLCSTNKFYSKIFADLFAELATKYDWLRSFFDAKYIHVMELFNDIQYVDSNADYDGFCEMNKKNDRRRAISTFYLNLALNGFIEIKGIVKVLKEILVIILEYIYLPDKKNEVDELTEVVAILFNRDMINELDDEEIYYINGESILETISGLAQRRAKDYPSLSNKVIFKYMDLVDM